MSRIDEKHKILCFIQTIHPIKLYMRHVPNILGLYILGFKLYNQWKVSRKMPATGKAVSL